MARKTAMTKSNAKQKHAAKPMTTEECATEVTHELATIAPRTGTGIAPVTDIQIALSGESITAIVVTDALKAIETRMKLELAAAAKLDARAAAICALIETAYAALGLTKNEAVAKKLSESLKSFGTTLKFEHTRKGLNKDTMTFAGVTKVVAGSGDTWAVEHDNVEDWGDDTPKISLAGNMSFRCEYQLDDEFKDMHKAQAQLTRDADEHRKKGVELRGRLSDVAGLERQARSSLARHELSRTEAGTTVLNALTADMDKVLASIFD